MSSRMQMGRFTVVFAVALGLTTYIPYAHAAPSPHGSDVSQSTPAGQNPLTRKLSDKERFKQQKELKQELHGYYKKWLNQDVKWIITDQERKAFLSLSNDEERDAFIEQFWRRRNPNPDSPENTYREEHYRRIAYANEHFSDGVPGRDTDRGMIYIKYGPPDSIDAHPSGGTYERPMSEGGGTTSTYPFTDWYYRYIPGVGSNITIEFVDQCMCGNYVMTMNPGAKDALLHVPGAGLTWYEQMGMAKKSQRFEHPFDTVGAGPMSAENQAKEFDRLEQYAKLEAPPVIKFKDLEDFITSHKILTGPILPFEVQTDFVKITDDTVLVPITIQVKNKNITFKTQDGVSTGVLHILGRVSTITDRVVQTFEDTVQVQVPAELLPKTMNNADLYWKALPLRPGRYRLDIAIKDVNNPDHVGIYARALTVPLYNDDELSASSLVLADKMSHVPAQQIGAGNFIIGDTFVRPRVAPSPLKPVVFHRNQDLNFWMQVYNLGLGKKTKKNDAKITFQIIDKSSKKTLLDTSENSQTLGAYLDQVTIAKSMPLASLQPGQYAVKVSVHDPISGQEIAQTAPFTLVE